MLYIIAYIFFKWLLWLIYRPKVFGNKKNLRIKGGVIFIANHRALYDPLLLVVSSPRIIHFMAKKELFDNPVGRVFFKSLFVFPVNRKTADMKSIRQSLKLLRRAGVRQRTAWMNLKRARRLLPQNPARRSFLYISIRKRAGRDGRFCMSETSFFRERSPSIATGEC